MSSPADSEFDLQDYADFCDLDGLSSEDAAAVIAALFEDFEITSTQTEGTPSSTQEHKSVAPPPESATEVAVPDESQNISLHNQTVNEGSETEAPEPAALPEEVYCAICTDTKPQTEFFDTNFCTHMYCNDCIGSYVTEKVQDGIAWINCPSPDCEAGFLNQDACRPVLSRNMSDRWGYLLCESTIHVKFYCPYKDCSALLMDDDDGDDGDENGNGEEYEIITQSECPHCHRMFCAQCRSLWHNGLKCEEFQELGEGDRDREDLKLKEVAESSHWRRCPECKYFVEKNEGCNHIICRCKYEFCYSCGAKWKSSHYSCGGAE